MDFWSGQKPFELTIVSSNALFSPKNQFELTIVSSNGLLEWPDAIWAYYSKLKCTFCHRRGESGPPPGNLEKFLHFFVMILFKLAIKKVKFQSTWRELHFQAPGASPKKPFELTIVSSNALFSAKKQFGLTIISANALLSAKKCIWAYYSKLKWTFSVAWSHLSLL